MHCNKKRVINYDELYLAEGARSRHPKTPTIQKNRLFDSIGSNATEPFGARADQCLLFPASDQIADKSRMARWAKSNHLHCEKAASLAAVRRTVRHATSLNLET
jgi:hypothetical protein